MRESGYFPLGAEYDPSAPWNQEENPENEFDVTISQSLSKSTTVHTNDYIDEYDDFEKEHFMNTSDTDWMAAYKEEHYTPLQLIEILKKTSEEKLKEIENSNLISLEEKKRHIRNLKSLIKECDGWIEDETEVVED